MKILVLSDSFVLRDSLKALFQDTFNDTTIDTVSNIDDINNDILDNLDFAFIDASKKNIYPIEILNKVKYSYEKLKIMILDFNKDKDFFIHAAKLGVDGYILSISEKDEFIYIIKRIISGKKYYDSELIEYALDEVNKPRKFDLSKREIDVMLQVAKGLSNKEIAKNLEVTDFTVKKHVSKILNKLKLSNRQEIVTYLKQNNIQGKVIS